MPCFIGCLALTFPRVAIVLVVIFSDYIGPAFSTWLLPLAGFFFMPLTTLGYAFAWHQNPGGNPFQGLGLVILVLAVLIDLGLLGTSANSGRKTKAYRRAVKRV